MTPNCVHYGYAQTAQSIRQEALDTAYLTTPERFKGRSPAPPPDRVWVRI